MFLRGLRLQLPMLFFFPAEVLIPQARVQQRTVEQRVDVFAHHRVAPLERVSERIGVTGVDVPLTELLISPNIMRTWMLLPIKG